MYNCIDDNVPIDVLKTCDLSRKLENGVTESEREDGISDDDEEEGEGDKYMRNSLLWAKWQEHEEGNSDGKLGDNPYEQFLFEEEKKGMEQWSLASNCPSYMKLKGSDDISFTACMAKAKTPKGMSTTTQMDGTDKEGKTGFLDKHDEVEPTFNCSKVYHTGNDIGCTYLGTWDRKVEEPMQHTGSIAITLGSHCKGKLLDGSPMDILVDTGATSCLMSKSFFDKHKILTEMPRLKTNIKNIQVGNGAFIKVLYAIPVQMVLPSPEGKQHMFEFYTLVIDAPDQSDMIIGIKELFEIEGMIDTSTCSIIFKNRAVPLVPMKNEIIPPGETRRVPLQAKFCQEISGYATCKMILQFPAATFKIKVHRNTSALWIKNKSDGPLAMETDKAIGIIDLRSVGYYKLPYQVLETNLKGHYHFAKAQEIKDQYQEFSQHWYKFATVTEKDPDTWMEPSDPRRGKTDREIFDMNLNMTKSALSNRGKKRLKELCIENRPAFSLRDEIGECPNIKVDIEVIDDTPFFVRPFPIAESDKATMDKQMKRLVALGILTEKSTACTSPVMLITRKLTSDKRPVVDFRMLNTRILRRNTATPLMRDIFTKLGKSGCERMSCIDLKDAYHSIKLTDKAKEFCGILPYFGSSHYRYEVLPMGLSISPAKWMEYVNILLKDIEWPEKFIAIMDDILVFSSAKDHWRCLADLFVNLIKHGLKISLPKFQAFMVKLLYMGNIFEITKEGRMIVKALKTRTEAIQNIPTPKTVRGCKSFCGVVNYLALFCAELQRLLKPIYDLTRKGRPFVWTELHTKAFQEVKKRLVNPPVLHCPTDKGRYLLYTDTSRQHVGSSLWQIQNGKPRLVGYASKTLTPAALNYSVTELEMTGMLKSLEIWQYWIGSSEIDCAVDHKAVVDIMKAKTPPASNRIASLLEKLARFAFKLYYIKGKDLKLADYLSRLALDKASPAELIPISFHPKDILQTVYTDLTSILECHTYGIRTRQQAKEEGDNLPEVHGADKPLDPALKPEHQTKSKLPQVLNPKPVDHQQEQRVPERQTAPKAFQRVPTPGELLRRKLVKRSIKQLRNPVAQQGSSRFDDIPNEGDMPSGPKLDERYKLPPPISGRTNKPPTKQVTWENEKEIDLAPQGIPIRDGLGEFSPEIDLGTDTASPYHEGFAEPTVRKPNRKDFMLPPPLADTIENEEVIHKFLPKQCDVDKILKQLKSKVLRETHLPTDMRDMQAAYLSSPQFRDIFQYLTGNKLPANKKRAQSVAADAQSYMILDRLLFKVIQDKHGESKALLCIPTSKVDILLKNYHSSLVGSHAGMTKCAMTIKDRFYCPGLEHHMRAYITGCHMCQLFKKGKKLNRPYQKRVNLNTPAMSKVSMDIKHMCDGKGGYRYILVILCETTNFLVAVPLKTETATEICEAVFENYISLFGSPTHIITDKGPAFTSSLIEYFTTKFGIKQIMVSPTNHQSLQAEHGIKSLATLLLKHLTEFGKDWPAFVRVAMMNYNSYTTPNLDGLSPGELVFGHKLKIIPELEISIDPPVSGTFTQYRQLLDRKLAYLKDHIAKFRNKRQDLVNSGKEIHAFFAGQIVYLYNPKGAMLQSGTRKIACQFVGPLVVYKAVSPNQFLLMSLDGKVYPHLIEESRLKEGFIYTKQGNVKTLAQLKQVLLGKIAL